MLANYNTRRTSVVLNPRGRVLGGFGRLGENGEGGGDGDGPPGGGDVGEGSYGGDGPPGGGDVAEGDYGFDAAAFAQQQMDEENAQVAAQMAANASRAVTKAELKAKQEENQKALSIAGKVVSLGLPAAGAFLSILSGLIAYGGTPLTEAEIDAQFAAGRSGAQGSFEYLKQLDIIQNNLNAASKAGSEAAVIKLYQTYAKRNPDPAALAYWSQRFGPTITADEVLQFQQFLYANEPNLRPVAMTTTASQPGNNLALPIIAAVAAYFVLGA